MIHTTFSVIPQNTLFECSGVLYRKRSSTTARKIVAPGAGNWFYFRQHERVKAYCGNDGKPDDTPVGKQLTLAKAMEANGWNDLQCTCVAFSPAETSAYTVVFKDGTPLKIHMSQIDHFGDWEHDVIIRDPGKFQGERVAVRMAYEASLEGRQHDDFGDAQDGGFYCRVTFDGSPNIVCFRENIDGFVFEITNEVYERNHAAWVERQEAEEE